MSSKFSTIFNTRKTVWDSLGTKVEDTSSSAEALSKSGLDWNVIQKPICTADGYLIDNYKANVKETDNTVLGIVSNRYSVCQNTSAFDFTDALLNMNVKYEAAGEVQNGRRVCLLMKLQDRYFIAGDEIVMYLVFCNSHDGSTGLVVALTPVRLTCLNMMNLALRKSQRSWHFKHVGNIDDKLHEATHTLNLAHGYMSELGKEIDILNRIKLTDNKIIEYINTLVPMPDNATPTQKKNIQNIREDILMRHNNAPDLSILPKTAYRFINAVSDHSSHSQPLRQTSNYQENLFIETMKGLSLVDKAHTLVKASA